MDMGREVDDGLDIAQGRRPIRLWANLADEPVLDIGDYRLSVAPALGEDQPMARRQHGQKSATYKAARAGDQNPTHSAIILKPVGAA
jgi:hypothetical protein